MSHMLYLTEDIDQTTIDSALSRHNAVSWELQEKERGRDRKREGGRERYRGIYD